MIINGNTELIAHIGFPTHAFKAPMIYNPWFDSKGIDACVVPMGVKGADYAAALASRFGSKLYVAHAVDLAATSACTSARLSSGRIACSTSGLAVLAFTGTRSGRAVAKGRRRSIARASL